ncbi:hypothetical protein QNI16_35875 [Cytophagaceae bacterium YF14B1]|uniref:Uncharacterized protein n=1 Tax=Xanthocytophaga flava TaxID=3048013 RepID=A0AAE3QVT5_9BACT|nr:hypothetical protein [Xanthocytophaga flavus]MDJ1485916.1 hypothetical protein [Xanthocytophaga flavus]
MIEPVGFGSYRELNATGAIDGIKTGLADDTVVDIVVDTVLIPVRKNNDSEIQHH